MIQRIQTIFLALASGSVFGLFGVPFAKTTQGVASSAFFADSIYNIMDNPALIAFFVVCGLLALAAIFLYNNRALQLRISIFAVVADVLGAALAIWFYLQETPKLGNAQIEDGFGIGLPVLALVFLLLANYYIRKDENLVRSMDRLR